MNAKSYWYFGISFALIIAIFATTNANSGAMSKGLNSNNPITNTNIATLGTTERISVTSDGTPGDDYSSKTSISGDGRYVAFQSSADNFSNSSILFQVFVKDRSTGEIKLVSVSSTGVLANSQSDNPSISGNGQFIAFTSMGNNLIENDTNFCHDVFVHDLQSGETTPSSIASNGTLGNGCSGAGAGPRTISFDGRFVAFDSTSDNLVGGDTNGKVDIFVHDRQTGATERVSVASDGTQGNESSTKPSISADGRYISFASEADNLVPGDTNGDKDIFVHDRVTSQTERVNIASDGTEGGISYYDYAYSTISDNGRYVVFVSPSNNLVLDDDNGDYDVFVRDRVLNMTERVSIASDGTQGNSASSQFDSPAISGDGRYIAFQSNASNLVSGDSNDASDIFLHDIQTGNTILVSKTNDGTQGNAESFNPSISADGKLVAFDSVSTNIVCEDTPTGDIYVHDRLGSGKSILGYVTSITGFPFAGVTISAGQGLTSTTNSSGDYAFNELISCTYEVHAELEGHFFEPATIIVQVPQGMESANFIEVDAAFLPILLK